MALGLLLLQCFGGYGGSASLTARTVFRLTIIAIARQHAQLWVRHPNFQTMEAVLGQRNIPGIECQHVLRAQVPNQVGEGRIQLGAESWGEDMAASTQR